MTGATDLKHLLTAACPVLDPETYVFVCLPASYGDHAEWQPIASVSEREGLTLILRQKVARAHDLSYEGTFKRITLQVHSSLAAVGLTAAVSGRLAAAGISSNLVAAFYHDHIFVPVADADRAMAALATLTEQQ